MSEEPKCSRCSEPSVIRQGNQQLCSMHYRFGQMRGQAKRSGQAVPSHIHLHELHASLKDMCCPHCERKMNWRSVEGKSTVISLQHYRDGSFGLICRACNTRHAKMPGDTFRLVPPTHKNCGQCRKVVPLEAFGLQAGKWLNLAIRCRDCANSRARKWAKQNRDRVNRNAKESRRKLRETRQVEKSVHSLDRLAVEAQHIALGIGGGK